MMMMMEQQKKGMVCCDELPPLFAKYPWLVAECLEDDGIRDHYFYNINDPLSHYRCRIPELLGKSIRGFFHGWVILSSNVLWSLWNPLTSKIIRFPPLKDGDFIGQCCLSSPPDDDPGSVILLTRTNKPNFLFCRVNGKRKKLRWTEMSYAKQLKKMTICGGLLHSFTCCNGKVYAISSDGCVHDLVLQVDIVVKDDKQVVIKLLMLGPCPTPEYRSNYPCPFDVYYFLRGSCTELFCIRVEGTKKTVANVTLFKLDMTSNITIQELEGFKDWDLSNITIDRFGHDNYQDIEDLIKSEDMWEEMSDLKDAIFFVDLERDCSIFYNPVIGSELGGYIHIRGEMENVMFSYHVNNKTIVASTIPFPVLPTSNVSTWEYRLEDDHGEAKCIVDSEQQREDEIVVRSPNDKVGFNEPCLLNYPFDVVEMIMKFCVGVEYLNFRATCKECRLAAPVIQWRNETSLRRLQNYSLISPWLMVFDRNRGIITFTDPMMGDNYFIKNDQASVSIAEGSKIYCSRFGWLVYKVFDDYGRLVFFNPFTNDAHNLEEAYTVYDTLCFSAPPTSPDCMLVGFTSFEQKSRVHIFYVGRKVTKLSDLESLDSLYFWERFYLGDDIVSIRSPTFYGRSLYALCNNGKILVFKHLLDEDYSWKVIEPKLTRSGFESESQYYMTKCDQHLLLVVVGKFGKFVEVFKHNDSTEEWEKLDDLGNHMIYISDDTCICIDAQTPEMENKIYFPCLHPTNGKVVFYSLETCLFHTFNGRNIQQHFWGLFQSVHHHNPLAWIEPSWC